MQVFPDRPTFESRAQIREDALVDWMGADSMSRVRWPEPTRDKTTPVTLPLMLVYSGAVEPGQAPRDRAFCVLLAVSNKRAYTMLYDGPPALKHTAHVDKEGRAYPWATLSAAGQTIHGPIGNGWKSFRVADSLSPWMNASISDLRTQEGGPGFVNSISPTLLQAWDAMDRSELNHRANYTYQLYQSGAPSSPVEEPVPMEDEAVEEPEPEPESEPESEPEPAMDVEEPVEEAPAPKKRRMSGEELRKRFIRCVKKLNEDDRARVFAMLEELEPDVQGWNGLSDDAMYQGLVFIKKQRVK